MGKACDSIAWSDGLAKEVADFGGRGENGMRRSISYANWLSLIVWSLWVAQIGPVQVWGQAATTATLLGTVTDQSGAAIAGADVQVKNTGTGSTRSLVTDAQGRYRVSD